MAFKALLDANVLLEFFLKRKEYKITELLIENLLKQKYQAYITSSILHIIAYWLGKTYGKEKTKELLLELLSVVAIIDCRHDTAVKAINSSIVDKEDALQYYTAMYHGIDYYITLDKELRNIDTTRLTIYFPNEFISLSDSTG